jgi:ABC-type lipoprotein export system ATPase subunit
MKILLTASTRAMKIQLQNITKHFEIPGSDIRREILNGISLDIKSSDALAVVGPSGCGKSTLLNIIGTLDPPGSGIVTIDGKDVTQLTENQLAGIRNKKIGFVFQLHHLLPQLTLLENVLVPTIPNTDKAKRKAATDRAKELLESVGLADRTTQKPGQLSVGECQRAALVRALINQPDILLADEPTGSLDRESAENLGDLLVKINHEQNIAMVLVTHSEQLAKKMKQVYQLIDGKLF